MNNQSKILVTGGAGFIGSHLVKRLLGLGYYVKVLDDMSRGDEMNLSDVLNQVELIRGDIGERPVVDRAVEGVDGIVHLAAKVSVGESVEKPLLYHQVNAGGTLNLLDAAKGRVKKFIYASTCAVYGDPVRLPIDESHPLNPASPYAASKLSGESYCAAYSGSYGLPTTVLRLFNVYGPRQGADSNASVVVAFLKRIKRNEAPVIFGDGEQTRDFIYVDDVTELISRALASNATGVFNVGTGNPVSINRLAEIMLRTLSKIDLKSIKVKSRFEEIRQSEADFSKANEVFAFYPKIGLEEGIKRLDDAE